MKAPSTAWEAVTVPTNPPVVLWAWFRPAQAPESAVVQLPVQLWENQAVASQITIQRLASAIGIDALYGWMIYGQSYALDAHTSLIMQAPLPPPPSGTDEQIVFWPQPTSAPPIAAVSPGYSPSGTMPIGDLLPGESPNQYLDLIDSYWNQILYIESDIRRARIQLEQSVSKLSSLNRDLTFDELQGSDSSDRQAWQDARRFLRDSAHGIGRAIKEIDIGLLSSAGQRNRFLEIYESNVKPRIPFPGLKQTASEFEMYHKSAKNVLAAAQTALNKGTSDGERRANSVLQRIQQKIRKKNADARTKRL